MTDTPLTDAATFEILSSLQSGTVRVVRADVACDLERKLTICRAALGIRDHETIPEQKPPSGSLLVDDGSIRQRVYVDGAELERKLAAVTSERDDLRERLAEILAPIAAPPESAEIINENFFDLIAPSKCKCGKTTALNHPTLCEKHMHDLDS